MGIMAAGSLAMAGYGMYQQDKAAREARAAQEKANREMKQEAMKKGPEASTIDETALTQKRIASLQAGWAANFKTSRKGDLAKPSTALMGAGVKEKLGE
jgi:hypothetical protein